MRAVMVGALLFAVAPPPPPTLPGQGMPPAEREPNQATGFAGLGIEAQPDGSWLYVDPTGHFTAHFETDGSVNFADRWRRPDTRDSQTGRCCAKAPWAPSIRGGWAVTGPTEWVYRWFGEDVSGRKKAELLKATFDIRLALAIEHTQQSIDEALFRLAEDLDEVRRDRSLSSADKKQRVFEIWDDCDERMAAPSASALVEAQSEIDEARLDAAWQARRKVEAWIRVHMPPATSRGYSAGELAALDGERMSDEHFDPYTEVTAHP